MLELRRLRLSAPAWAAITAAAGSVAGCRRGAEAAAAPVIATVNGEAVTAADFKRELVQSRRGSEGLGPRSEEELQASRKAELQRLLERTELLQAARQPGIAATDEDVDKAYLSMRADYPGTSFDELLADEEITPAELRLRLRDQLTIHKLFLQNVFSRVAVTEPEVEAYYAAHKDEFSRQDEVHAEQIVVKTEEEAQAIRTAIKSGKLSFEAAAREHSLSPDAQQGGNLGWFARGMMPPVFDETCFALPLGELSPVITSSYGFHLFRVLEKRSAGAMSFSEAKAKIEAKLHAEKNAKAEAVFVDSLEAKAAVTVDEAAVARVR